MSEMTELDLLLARELEQDARLGVVDLAAKLNTSTTTIYRRMQRLLDMKAINIVTIPDSEALGFEMMVLIGIKTNSPTAVAECLKPCLNVRTIVVTTGHYDLFLSTVFLNKDELYAFMSDTLGAVPGVIQSETKIVLEIAKNSWKHLNSDTDTTKKAVHRVIDESERELIKELERYPRESIINLAKNLGLNRVTVSKKMQALLADNIVNVVSVTSPSAFGAQVQTLMLLSVHPGQIRAATNALISDHQIRHVLVTTGHFNLYLWGVFESRSAMSDFLVNDLGNIPGVTHREILLPVKVFKRSFALLSQA